MAKFLMLLMFVTVTLTGGTAPAQQRSTPEAANSQVELVLAAYKKHKHKKSRYSGGDWCQRKSNLGSCKICHLTYYGYCQCEIEDICQ